ncbi:hypothetical protein TrVE_jg2783 [Triparma verrucosa]|uniref:Uncharacterized protein n=1 Tax=Triparma verrucosa TaxID=1606542 RepID=A0A9W7BRB7_9STRA|nr:hypothetical protein TrVE_jg2783 [Triparma verrucosa]
MCLKVDLYQPKYANIPMTFAVKPCPTGTGFVEGYGVGTTFTGKNGMGKAERVTIKELVPLQKIVMECPYGGNSILMTYSTSLDVSSGACKLSFAYDGKMMGLFKTHVEMQIKTMGAFAAANIRAILDEAGGMASTAPMPMASPAPMSMVSTAPPAAFCGKCGAANSGTAFCTSCGAVAGGGGGGGGFVDVPQHAQAQQAQNLMMQQSMMNATIQANQAIHNRHHYSGGSHHSHHHSSGP